MVGHVKPVRSQSEVKCSVRNEEENKRRDHSFSNALRKHLLVEHIVELTGRIKLWIAQRVLVIYILQSQAFQGLLPRQRIHIGKKILIKSQNCTAVPAAGHPKCVLIPVHTGDYSRRLSPNARRLSPFSATLCRRFRRLSTPSIQSLHICTPAHFYFSLSPLRSRWNNATSCGRVSRMFLQRHQRKVD